MRKTSLTISILLLAIISSFSQIDSLIRELEKPDAEEGIIFEIQDVFNKIYYQNPPQSLTFAKTIDSLAHEKGFKSMLGKTGLMLGISYNINELYDEAVRSFLSSINHSAANKKAVDEAQGYNGLAVVWQVRKDTETSAFYFEKALEIYEEVNDTLWTGIIKLNLGGLYMEDELLEKADTFLVDAIIAMDKMKQPIYAGYGKLNLGSLRVKQKKYDEAIPILEEALQVVPQQVNPLIHAVGNTALGEAYFRLNRIPKSKTFLDRGLEQSKQIKNYEQLEVVTGLLSEYYEKLGRTSEAFNFYKKSTSLRDSFISQEQDQRLVDALKKYEAEKKEQEILLLSAENEYKDLRIERDRRNLIFALLGLGAFAGIASIILINRNRIKKLNAQLEQQKTTISQSLAEKELLLKEIHHRVKNNLQVISSLLSLQSSYVKSDSAVQALNLGRDRVKSMALIHQNLYQEGNLTGVKPKPYFDKLCKSLIASYSMKQDQFELDLKVEDLNIEVDTMISLGLIANELISNSLKHAFRDSQKGKLTVELYKKEEKIYLTVADNGKGIDPEMLNGSSDSFGFKMIHAFKDKLDANLVVESKDGTHVEMTFDA